MPVTALTREFTLTYGSYTVGGASGTAGADVHGFPQVEGTRDGVSITFDVVITADSASDFATACDALEDAFSKPYQNLTWAFGATNMVAVTQSGNTGMNARASWSLPGGPPDSARSRRYRIRIEYDLPASWSGNSPSGLRDATATLGKSPAGRAAVTLRGTFTAVAPSTSAVAAHDAGIAALASSWLSTFGISSYELVEERELRVDRNNKVAQFERVYRELLFSQGGASDDSAIVEQVLVVTRARRGSEYSPATDGGEGATSSSVTAAPLMDLTARYEAWVAADVTTDLKSKWSSIESWVIEQVRNVAGSSGFGLLRCAPSYNHDENRISATIEAVVPNPEGGDLLQNVVETVRQTIPGYEFVPVWDGDPEAALVFQGMKVVTETVTRRYRQLSGGSGAAGGAGGSFPNQAPVPNAGGGQAAAAEEPARVGAAPDAPAQGGSQWFLLAEKSDHRPFAVGVGSDVIVFDERWTTRVRRRVTAI